MGAQPWHLLVALLLIPGLAPGAELPPVQDIAPLAEAAIPVAGDWAVFGFDALWVTDRGRVHRIDPIDNGAKEIIRLEGPEGHPRAPAVGEGAVWIASPEANAIYRLDPASNTVTLKISAEMIDQEGSLGVGAGSVWTVTQGTENRYEQTLSRFDAATGETKARIALPAGGAGVIASGGFIWVTSPLTGQIFKVDPESNTVAATLDVGGSPRFITAGEGALWVVDQRDATVQRIDPESGSVVARIATGESGGPGGDIDAGGGFVWVAWAHRSTGTQIDPASNAVAAHYASSGPITSMRYGAGSVWIAGRPKLLRLRIPMVN